MVLLLLLLVLLVELELMVALLFEVELVEVRREEATDNSVSDLSPSIRLLAAALCCELSPPPPPTAEVAPLKVLPTLRVVRPTELSNELELTSSELKSPAATVESVFEFAEGVCDCIPMPPPINGREALITPLLLLLLLLVLNEVELNNCEVPELDDDGDR